MRSRTISSSHLGSRLDCGSRRANAELYGIQNNIDLSLQQSRGRRVTVLILNKRHLREISEHSRASFPVEACGILVGRRGYREKIVERVCPAKNILGSTSRYEVDPEELIKVFGEAERESNEVLGFYHSHPHWPAYASEMDRSSAFYPNYSYLIYSNLEDEARSYVWDGERFRPEKIKIV